MNVPRNDKDRLPATPSGLASPSVSVDRLDEQKLNAKLLNHEEVLHLKTYSFEGCGATAKDIDSRDPASSEETSVLRQVIGLTQREMTRMNAARAAIPVDSTESLLQMMITPGAKVVTLQADLPQANGATERTVVGYGFIFTDKRHFPDGHDIPPSLMTEARVCRVNRLFVSGEGGAYGPRGEAAGKIIDEFQKISNGAPLLVKILIGPEDYLTDEWKFAQHALERRGFEQTEFASTEVFRHSPDKEVPLFFKWGVFPPPTEQGRATQAAYQRYFSGLSEETQRRLAPTTAHVPISDATIVCRSHHHDAFDLANLYPGNYIVNFPVPGSSLPPRDERRPNLSAVGAPLPPQSVDCFYNSFVIGDEAENLNSLVQEQKVQLKSGGKCLIRVQSESPDEIHEVLEHNALRVISMQRESVKSPAKGDAPVWMIIGEKIPDGQGIALQVKSSAITSDSGFLSLSSFKQGERIWDLVKRPNPTIDTVPWFELKGQVYVVGRNGYRRPIAQAADPFLDDSFAAGYMTEQIAAIVDVKRLENESLTDIGAEVLEERALIPKSQVRRAGTLSRYFSSPGAVDEEVISVALEIAPFLECRVLENKFADSTTLSVVQAIEATQVLKSAQQGGMQEGRLERMVYILLAERGDALGPWLGEKFSPSEQALKNFTPDAVEDVLTHPVVAAFTRMDQPSGKFFEIRNAECSERGVSGDELARVQLQFVRPARATGLSTNTISALPFMRIRSESGEIDDYVGVEVLDLPAVQMHRLGSTVTAAPLFRIPRDIGSLGQAEQYLKDRFDSEFNLRVKHCGPLGGKYFSSIGVTPEAVYPYLLEIDAASALVSPLRWVRLRDLSSNLARLEDGHLVTGAARAAHALGIFEK